MQQTALRRLPRPEQIVACPICHAAIATNYPACVGCMEMLEKYWLADWHALIAAETIQPHTADEPLFAQIIIDEGERHPWTVLDIAMTLLQCATCDNELGGGPIGCAECAEAWGITLWAETLAARAGLVTMNEHALHVGRMILRHRHRQSANIIAAWSRTVPRLLTGWLPSTVEAQQMMALVKAGRMDEVDARLAALDRKINETSHY